MNRHSVKLLVGTVCIAACAGGAPVAPQSAEPIVSTPVSKDTASGTPRAIAPPVSSSAPAVASAEASVPTKPENRCGGDDPEAVRSLLSATDDAANESWSALSPSVRKDIDQGKPLVVFVFVPLCSNQQIWCGSKLAGDPVGLRSNIYWGAVFGARRFFDEYRSPYERVETKSGSAPDLERIVYRLRVPGEPWGRPAGERVEQFVVLQAVHGSHINGAVERFWKTATQGGCVTFQDGDQERTERIHVVGYAGHNRLMDNVALPPAPPAEQASPIPSFVLACFSERYFGPSLRRAGARPLVTTRSYMAPEGYLVRAIAEGLAANESPEGLRQRAANTQRSWQKQLSPFQSMWIFWPFEK